MQVHEKEINDIKPYDRNPRKNDIAVAAVAESISQFGFKVPVIVDADGVIVAGHTRYKAAKQLDMKTIPCIVADDLTEAQIKAFRLADNKTAELAEWDLDLLNNELLDLDNLCVDMSVFGFNTVDTIDDKIIEDNIPDIDDESEPITQLGDIWQLGKHRLMCGDSTDAGAVAILMDGKKADMIVSDPPYGMCLDTDFSGAVGSLGRKGGTRGNKYNKVIGDNEDFKPELITTFFNNFAYCKEIFLFGADYFAELLPNKNDGSWLCWDKRKESQSAAIGSEFELIWSKNKHKRRMLRHDWFGFLSSQNANDAQHRVHPTQKPVTLLVDIINQWGAGCEVIVDLYGGSGSTLIACEQLSRKCYGNRSKILYCDVIINRWEKITGRKAEKVIE